MRTTGVLRAIVGAIALTVFPITVCLAGQNDAAPGQLTIVQKDGKYGALCPLENTRVQADITGFGARVVVVQTFANPSKEPIEAIYTFPLPNDAAVDRMRMKIGNRIVEGEIKRREEARLIYETARAAGQTASLLDQERPNIFTQSVANIMPGAKIEVEISYVELLKYEEGQFEFSFPMVVGPRFLGNAPDPGKIAPPVTPEGTRTGATIQLNVDLDAGAPIQAMESVLHEVAIKGQVGQNVARIALKKKDEIPNRDFILRYRTAADSVQSAFLTHMDQKKGGFFQLILLPPKVPTAQQIGAKEIIFVVDQSGSQQGFPIDKSKELALKLIGTLRPGDAFNVMGFSNEVNRLWKAPREATEDNLVEARKFISNLQANGGTQLKDAVEAAMNGFTVGSKRVPIVLFNTDGFVGDEAAILESIRKNRGGARIFTFGIGNGCNRYLIDGMSAEGRGDAEYVTLREAADAAVERFVRRIDCPILTDVQVSFEGVQVTQALPERVPDVFSEKPIMICGRYEQPGQGKVVISGMLGGKPWVQKVPLEFGARSDAPAIPTLWARREVDELTRKIPVTPSADTVNSTVKDQIIQLALDFGIMTDYTSFVAVEKKVVNIGGKQRTVAVPVEMTEGVSYEGALGTANQLVFFKSASSSKAVRRVPITGGYGGSGGFGGGGARGGKQVVEERDSEASVSSVKANGVELKGEKAANYVAKVSKKLHTAKGKVEIQISLTTFEPANLEKIAALGVKIAQSDKGLKVVFAECDAKKLAALAQLEFVRLISPL